MSFPAPILYSTSEIRRQLPRRSHQFDPRRSFISFSAVTDAGERAPVEATRVNALGTAAVFAAAGVHRCERVIFASSISAVGPTPGPAGRSRTLDARQCIRCDQGILRTPGAGDGCTSQRAPISRPQVWLWLRTRASARLARAAGIDRGIWSTTGCKPCWVGFRPPCWTGNRPLLAALRENPEALAR